MIPSQLVEYSFVDTGVLSHKIISSNIKEILELLKKLHKSQMSI